MSVDDRPEEAADQITAAYLPTTPQLLAAVADALDAALAHVPDHLTHRLRVAANLTRLVERESALGPGVRAATVRALRSIPAVDASVPDHELLAVVADLARTTDDPDIERTIRAAMLEVTRLELEIAKPGYTDWDRG